MSAWDGEGTRWLLAIPLAFSVAFLAIPLAWVVVEALGGGFFDAIGDDLFLQALRRTALMAAIVTAICWPLAVIYCLAACMAGRTVRIVLLGTLVLTFWISLLVRTYGWVLLLQPAGAIDKALRELRVTDGSLDLLGKTPAMYPAMVHVMLPYMVLPIYAALRAIDVDQLRAARSLGTGPLRILTKVVLPSLRQASVAGGTLVFILSFGFFVTPAFLGGPGSLTVATLINRQFNQLLDTGSAAAMGTVLMVVVLGGYVVATRLLKVDVAAGARA